MNPLDQLPLRDIHLPDPTSWWPPAIGWWLLLPVAVALLIAGWLFMKHLRAYLRRRRFHRLVLRELAHIEEEYQQRGDAHVLLEKLSILLRRVSLSVYPRHQVAGRTGDDWVGWLNARAGHEVFDGSMRTLLAHGPYRRTADMDAPLLLGAARQWLEKMRGSAAAHTGGTEG